MPSLAELTALFDELPEIPPPMPRVRQKPPPNDGGKSQRKTTENDVRRAALDNSAAASATSTLASLFSFWPFQKEATQQLPRTAPERRPHPMATLKQGKKVAIIAVVDAGSPSFFRFGQGEFSERPIIG